MRPDATRRSWVLAALCAAQFMLVLDIAIVNVALPSIQADLGFAPGDLQWVISAYALTFGGFLMLAGRAGDLFGRRRLFLAGTALFTVASIACGFAQNDVVLVVSRGFQGLGAALMSPSALSLLTTSFREGDERNRALGLWGAVAAGGAAAGVLLGGVVTDTAGWRWVFFVNVPVGVALFALVPRLVAESTEGPATRRLDVSGAASLTAGLVALVFGLSRIEADGPGSGAVVLSFAVAGTLLAVFVVQGRAHQDPLVPFRVFRSRRLTGANLVALLTSGIIAGQAFFSTLYLQQVLGYSPIRTGLAFIPITVTVMVVATLVPRVLTRVDVRMVMVCAAVALGAGMWLWSRVPADGAYFIDVLPGLVVVAVGLGCSFTAALIAATAGVADDEQGLASGLLNTSEQVGASIGIAVLATVAASRTGELTEGGFDRLAALDGFQLAFRAGIAFAVLELIVALFVVPRTTAGPTDPLTALNTTTLEGVDS